MKTLDEVIHELEGKIACETHVGLRDALQYLKAYRENQHAYEEGNRKAEEARERYLEALKNCELAENKYKRLCKETSQNFADTSQKITCPQCHSEFVILPEANNPLTWSELKQMEGKPVWVEHKHYNKWLIVYEVYENTIVLDGNGFYTQYFSDDNEKEIRWQAYRKERE